MKVVPLCCFFPLMLLSDPEMWARLLADNKFKRTVRNLELFFHPHASSIFFGLWCCEP